MLRGTGGGRLNDWSLQGRLEGCVGALLFALLPALLYAVTNLGLAWNLRHVWSLLLLSSAPLLMLTTMKVEPLITMLCCHCEKPCYLRGTPYPALELGY